MLKTDSIIEFTKPTRTLPPPTFIKLYIQSFRPLTPFLHSNCVGVFVVLVLVLVTGEKQSQLQVLVFDKNIGFDTIEINLVYYGVPC